LCQISSDKIYTYLFSPIPMKRKWRVNSSKEEISTSHLQFPPKHKKKKKKKKKPIFPYNNTSVAEHDAVYLVQFLQTPPHQGRGSHWSSASNPKTHTRALGVIFRSKSRFSQTIYFPPNKSI
jgi:hypothetical protein